MTRKFIIERIRSSATEQPRYFAAEQLQLFAIEQPGSFAAAQPQSFANEQFRSFADEQSRSSAEYARTAPLPLLLPQMQIPFQARGTAPARTMSGTKIERAAR
jgi:hypothetical protein